MGPSGAWGDGSSLLLTAIQYGINFLRERIAGDYLVISDDLATETMKNKYSLSKTVTLAAKAGVDVLLISGNQPEDAQNAFKYLLEAVREGIVAEQDIDGSFTKILSLKSTFGNLSERYWGYCTPCS